MLPITRTFVVILALLVLDCNAAILGSSKHQAPDKDLHVAASTTHISTPVLSETLIKTATESILHGYLPPSSSLEFASSEGSFTPINGDALSLVEAQGSNPINAAVDQCSPLTSTIVAESTIINRIPILVTSIYHTVLPSVYNKHLHVDFTETTTLHSIVDKTTESRISTLYETSIYVHTVIDTIPAHTYTETIKSTVTHDIDVTETYPVKNTLTVYETQYETTTENHVTTSVVLYPITKTVVRTVTPEVLYHEAASYVYETKTLPVPKVTSLTTIYSKQIVTETKRKLAPAPTSISLVPSTVYDVNTVTNIIFRPNIVTSYVLTPQTVPFTSVSTVVETQIKTKTSTTVKHVSVNEGLVTVSYVR